MKVNTVKKVNMYRSLKVTDLSESGLDRFKNDLNELVYRF